MKKLIVLLGVVLLIVTYWRITAKKTEMVEMVSSTETTETKTEVEYSTLTKEFGSIDITIEPDVLLDGNEMVFFMSINTHSGDLDYDWMSLSKLEDDLGNIYKVTNWKGGSGGHHLRGELVFEPLDGQAKEVTLTMMNIDGVTESFSWSI